MTHEEEEHVIQGQRSMNLKQSYVTVTSAVAILLTMGGIVWKASEIRYQDIENARLAREQDKAKVLGAIEATRAERAADKKEVLQAIQHLNDSTSDVQASYQTLILDITKRVTDLERQSGDRWSGSMMIEYFLRSEREGVPIDPATIIERYQNQR